MHPRERIEFRSAALRAAGQWRDSRPFTEDEGSGQAGAVVDARSNDYLGLSRRCVSRETEPTSRLGAGASRLISGTHSQHLALEEGLSAWLGTEASLVFSSGYAANVGAISALVGPGETILSDELNHASIIDGCRLSRANVVILPHADLNALERALAASRGVRWFITESYFGMDGDSPDLAQARSLCDRAGAALLVDEAHAIGVFGPDGRGLCAAAGVTPDVLVGGMGKAFGMHGGFVACSEVFRAWLWNRARAFVFSTAPGPLFCELALGQLQQLQTSDSARQHLRNLELRLVAVLEQHEIPLPPGRHGPIFPLIFGSESAALRAAAGAEQLGVLTQPIRPPTVPSGTSRLRVTLRAPMTTTQVDTIGRALVTEWQTAMSQKADPRDLSGQGPAPDHSSPPQMRTVSRETEAPVRTPEGLDDAPEALIGRTAPTPAPFAPRDHPASTLDSLSMWKPDQGPRPQTPLVPQSRSSRATDGDAGRVDATLFFAPQTSVPARPTSPTAGTASGGGPPAPRPPGDPASDWDPAKRAATLPVLLDAPADDPPPPEALPEHAALPRPLRWVVLGTGTGAGKTFAARGLVQLTAERSIPAVGLKPIETGLDPDRPGDSDAALLASTSFHVKLPECHPLYGFPEPITPARAARAAAQTIDLTLVARWVRDVEQCAPAFTRVVIETAGGVFSPLSDIATNFELASQLEPAQWVLVAPDRLGVLHDVTSCVIAMQARGRLPNYIVLSAPADPDASTGTNAAELARNPRMPPIVELPRGDIRPLLGLLEWSP